MLPMASVTARSVLAALSLATVGGGNKVNDAFWGLLDDMATDGSDKSDVTTVADMLDHGAGIQVEDCGEKMDVMHVARTEFSRAHLQVRAYGNLSRSVSGGTVSVKMYKGSAAGGSSTADWMKRELAWHSVPHKYEEELCKHFGRSHSKRGCPLPAGNIELRFALDELPPMVLAGAYRLKIRAIDAAGNHVACLQANVQVPRGKSGELFRRIQALPNAHNGRALTSGASDCNCDFSDPVCGDNGLTYDSACQAHCSSAKVAYTGKCGDLLPSVGRALSSDNGCVAQAYCSCGDNLTCTEDPCGPYTSAMWTDTCNCIDTIELSAGCAMDVSDWAQGSGTRWGPFYEDIAVAHVGIDYDTIRSIRVYPAYQTCEDVDDWVSPFGSTCLQWSQEGWCIPSGEYPSSWEYEWGTFENYSFMGHMPTEACCACGGGEWTCEGDKDEVALSFFGEECTDTAAECYDTLHRSICCDTCSGAMDQCVDYDDWVVETFAQLGYPFSGCSDIAGLCLQPEQNYWLSHVCCATCSTTTCQGDEDVSASLATGASGCYEAMTWGWCEDFQFYHTCCDTCSKCDCDDYWEPVCGYDGMTYSNSCEADCYANGYEYWGECAIECDCEDNWEPVCGYDGMTYSNSCEADCYANGYQYWGECASECDCEDYWDPVCGYDGVTYSNSCEADCHANGYLFWGECHTLSCDACADSNRDCEGYAACDDGYFAEPGDYCVPGCSQFSQYMCFGCFITSTSTAPAFSSAFMIVLLVSALLR